MTAQPSRSWWVRVAFALLGVMWFCAGWFVILSGGFHKTVKRSKETTFVDGWRGESMAYVLLALSAIAAAVVLQSFSIRKSVQIGVAVAILAAPLLYRLGS